MTVDDLKNYYKSGYEFNKKTGISSPQYFYWIKIGYIPKTSQCRIEIASNGDLKADLTESVAEKVKNIDKKIDRLLLKKKKLQDESNQ